MPEIARIIHGVNPARAGMILCRILFQILFRGKPRASGDDPFTSSPQYSGLV